MNAEFRIMKERQEENKREMENIVMSMEVNAGWQARGLREHPAGTMAWDGGNGVTATNCDFSYTSLARVSSHTYNGLDIEWENGQSRVTNGTFINCRFVNNKGSGIQCDNGFTSATRNRTSNFSFWMCKIVGAYDAASGPGWTIWPDGKNFDFRNCDLYGLAIHAYDDYLSCSNCTSIGDNTKFTFCTFNEVDQNFSYNGDPGNECSNDCPGTNYCLFTVGSPDCQPCCNGGSHNWLVDFSNGTPGGGSSGVFFLHSHFFATYQDKLVFLSGKSGNFPINNQKLRYSDFHNYGINDCSGSPNSQDEIDIYYTTHFPNTIQTTHFFTRNIEYPSASYIEYEGAPHPTNVGPFPPTRVNQLYNRTDLHPCLPKFYNPTYPNKWDGGGGGTATTTEAAFCPAICYPPCNLRESDSSKIQPDVAITPNPSAQTITVLNIASGDAISVYDALGNCLLQTNAKETSSQFDISRLSAGIYFIKVNSKAAGKFIKSDSN